MICHNATSEQVCKANGFDIVQCANCSLQYTERLPNEGSVVNAYQHDSPVTRTAFNQFRKTLKFRFRMMTITKLATVHGRFLDIGCAEGDWGAAVQGNRQWDYLGLELQKGLLTYAKDRCLNVAPGTLVDQKFPNEEFSLVTMTHVLEHLYDPRGTLMEISRVLKPSGLVVIEVPDTSHPKSERKKKQGRWYGPPGHLWYFSQKTLHQFLNVLGFTPILSKRTMLKPYVWVIARKSTDVQPT